MLKLSEFRIGLLIAALSFALLLPSSAFAFLVTNDSNSFSVAPITGAKTAAEYYDYNLNDNGGDPAFGPEANTGFFWLYQQEGSLSAQLCMIFNKYHGGAGSYIDMKFSSLPSSASTVYVDDDSTELSYSGVGDIFEGDWYWSSFADGGVVGDFSTNPENDWEIHVAVGNDAAEDYEWYFISGDDKYAHSLTFYDDGTFEESGSLTDTQLKIAIPEPATIAIFGLGGLLLRRRGSA